jgi:hypothetical protein
MTPDPMLPTTMSGISCWDGPSPTLTWGPFGRSAWRYGESAIQEAHPRPMNEVGSASQHSWSSCGDGASLGSRRRSDAAGTP